MNFVTDRMATEHNRTWGDKYLATENCVSGEDHPSMMNVELLWQQISELKSIGDQRVFFLPEFSEPELDIYYKNPGKFISNTPCLSTWAIAQVMADGEVIPYTRCYHVPLGNVNSQSFLEIWNGEKAASWRGDLRKHKRFPACTRCDMVH